jgi:hypothetical protein
MKRKLWIGVLGLVATLWLVAHWHGQRTEVRTTADKDEILVNRLWVDRIPQKETDQFHILAVLTQRQKVGVFQHGSVWEGDWAAFQWQFQGKDKDLHIRFPQSGKTAEVKWSIQDCRKTPFDYCMDTKGNPRGPEKWYSRKDWVIGSVGDIQDLKDLLRAE